MYRKSLLKNFIKEKDEALKESSISLMTLSFSLMTLSISAIGSDLSMSSVRKFQEADDGTAVKDENKDLHSKFKIIFEYLKVLLPLPQDSKLIQEQSMPVTTLSCPTNPCCALVIQIVP